MKRTVLALTLALAALAVTEPVLAQVPDFELPEYTEQQRWNRLASGLVSFQAAIIKLGEEHGMTPEEVGAFVGEFFSTSWVSGVESVPFLVNYNRNHTALPGAESELISYDAREAQARFNRPWEAWVGLDHQIMGVPSDAFLEMGKALTMSLSQRVGVTTTWETDGDHDLLTFRTEYGPIGAHDNLRYGRSSYLSWLNWLELLDTKMRESGLSAREVGLQQGDIYAPSWGSVTPWQLFRGMTWNGLAMDRTMQCEILSASPEEVQARCSHTVEQRIAQGSGYFDVTVEDVLENRKAFAERVAEHRGMVWEETWEPGYRIIRVRMR